MLEGLMRALKILKEEHLSNYEEELLMEDLVEKLEGEILNNKKEYLNRLYSKLDDMLCDEACMSNDILDLTLDIISQQRRVIKDLDNKYKELNNSN